MQHTDLPPELADIYQSAFLAQAGALEQQVAHPQASIQVVKLLSLPKGRDSLEDLLAQDASKTLKFWRSAFLGNII